MVISLLTFSQLRIFFPFSKLIVQISVARVPNLNGNPLLKISRVCFVSRDNKLVILPRFWSNEYWSLIGFIMIETHLEVVTMTTTK
ncbi:hypothetical protein L1987_52621 [Smallanthus sonchifolius]|uniref:Uncharacterized protein n=1 Tax=Smallanthus sonchifolius TaxID=185202 RepID=A0ACB9ETN0_9ASTR|nr:hypothetical protein L1987_52621 [Smallanthus sonchifolius]